MQPAQFVELGHALAAALPVGVEQPIGRSSISAVASATCNRRLLLSRRAISAWLSPVARRFCTNSAIFQRLQSLALFVLDHLVVVVGRRVDEGRYLRQAGQLGRTQTPGAEVEYPAARLLCVRPNGDRLPHAMAADRRGQFPASRSHRTRGAAARGLRRCRRAEAASAALTGPVRARRARASHQAAGACWLSRTVTTAAMRAMPGSITFTYLRGGLLLLPDVAARLGLAIADAGHEAKLASRADLLHRATAGHLQSWPSGTVSASPIASCRELQLRVQHRFAFIRRRVVVQGPCTPSIAS